MLPEHTHLRQSLCTRCLDIVLLQYVEHTRTGKTRNDRQRPPGESDSRQDLTFPAAPHRRGKNSQPQSKYIDEQCGNDKAWYSHSERCKTIDDPVLPLVPFQCRGQSGRNAKNQSQSQTFQAKLQGNRKSLPDDVIDTAPGIFKRRPHISMQDIHGIILILRQQRIVQLVSYLYVLQHSWRQFPCRRERSPRYCMHQKKVIVIVTHKISIAFKIRFTI